jgi:hypothetical protein
LSLGEKSSNISCGVVFFKIALLEQVEVPSLTSTSTPPAGNASSRLEKTKNCYSICIEVFPL